MKLRQSRSFSAHPPASACATASLGTIARTQWWKVKVTVAVSKLDSIGVVMDFHELERRLDQILAPWKNSHLNQNAAFADLNPSG